MSEAQSLNKNLVLRSEEFASKLTAHIWAFEGSEVVSSQVVRLILGKHRLKLFEISIKQEVRSQN